jgi:hypothetical protein
MTTKSPRRRVDYLTELLLPLVVTILGTSLASVLAALVLERL